MLDKPNILFVFPDQLGARWMSCYGNRHVSTPALNRFASQSVQFDRAYTNTPLCTPYRGCLFTGQYPSQTGVTENGMRLPRNQQTLADLLNKAGYETHYVGKWHLSGDPQTNRWVPPEERGGFQYFTGWESHHVDHSAGLIWRDDPDHPIELGGHETDGLTDIVCNELDALTTANSPFFMVVAYQAPHPPCTPPASEYEQYDGSVLDEPPNTQPEAWFRNTAWGADYGVEEFRKRYFGEISQLDAAFGRILDKLQKTGLDENTIVIFTSDHGEMCGSHGLFGKGVMYEEAVRVPLLIRMPTPGSVDRVERPVSTVDLFSTILDFAGADGEGTEEGRSLIPDIKGAEVPASDVFIEQKEDCVIRGDIKLVTERDRNDILRCCDLAQDPFELTDIGRQVEQETKEELLRSLNQWRARTRN